MGVARLVPYLVPIILGALLITFAGRVTISSPPLTGASSSSPGVLLTPSPPPSPLDLPVVTPQTNVPTSSSSTVRLTILTKKPFPVSAQKPAATSSAFSIPAPTPPSSENSALDAASIALRLALVNIVCYAPPTGTLRSITGSGVIIDSKGIILTNAHIAQYFLLADQDVSCLIRTGAPAISSYKASLIYISPNWVSANAKVVTETTPSGTGQYDFAFLAVTASATPAQLPPSFPYVPLATEAPSIGTPVAIASYAAQSLKSNQIESALFPTTVFGSVKNVFTFAINSVDVLGLGGSAAAQEGSSGGGVVDKHGELVGTLTTSTISGAISSRTLDAITASYMRAEYASETGQALNSLLAEPSSISTANYASRMPALEALITKNLP